MPLGHDTVVGSGGINLSGGQRQRIAIARALYARKAILVLDDMFSGLDPESEQHVFRKAVGPEGLAREKGMTVIFATHAVKFLPYSDHIIAFGADGKVVQQGSYATLKRQPGYVRSLAVGSEPQVDSNTMDEKALEGEASKIAERAAEDDLSRQLGDLSVYRYYFRGCRNHYYLAYDCAHDNLFHFS